MATTLLAFAVSYPPSQRRLNLEPEPRVDEAQLIRRVLGGDRLAERELYDTHVDRVYRLAYRMTGDEELAQEFTQEAFIKAFNALPEFRGDASLSTWLHAITVSCVLNGLRKVKRHRQREVELDGAPEIPVRPTAGEPRLRDRLKKAIDALSERYRTVFVMHEIEGYTHEEIGAVLQVAAGTSKAMLFHARAKLREQLADLATEYVR